MRCNNYFGFSIFRLWVYLKANFSETSHAHYIWYLSFYYYYYYLFNFLIVNFPFICSNIPAAPAYRVYLSQMIRYSRACGSYQDFLVRGLLLTKKLLNQGFLVVNLKSSLRKFYGRHHDLVDRYGISVSQMTTDMFHLS
jgi:hypothetical protein